VIGDIAHDGAIAPLRIGKAEALAATGTVEPVRLLALAAGARHGAVQRAHDLAIGGVEHDAADGKAVAGRMNGEDVMMAAGAAEPDRTLPAFDLLELPHPAEELGRASRITQFDLDAADAAHSDCHAGCLESPGPRQFLE
jgi:hypothetical protein